MVRRFSNLSVQELEAAFALHRSETALLRELAEELSHRESVRETALREAIEARLHSLRTIVGHHAEPTAELAPIPAQDEEADAGSGPPPTNFPEQVLSAWVALETLVPRLFHFPEDFAAGDRRTVASLDEAALPWELGEKARSNSRLYYQIVLGSIRVEPLSERLAHRFGGAPKHRAPEEARAVLAVVIVDRQGRLAPSRPPALSSFGWAVMTALNGELTDLVRWPQVELAMSRHLERRLLGEVDGLSDAEARSRPLTRAALMSGYQALLEETGLPAEWVDPPSFALRSHTEMKNPNPPAPIRAKSAFLTDLCAARALYDGGASPALLSRYLAAKSPHTPRDLLRDHQALDDALAPSLTPLARWPGPDQRSLAALPQAAVNLAFSEMEEGGLLGVSGPRGDQVAVLRDLVASVVAARAEALSRFDEPRSAFAPSGETMKTEGGSVDLHRIDPALRGFEMVVAAEKGAAGESLVRQLAGLGSIAADASDLRYFKDLADLVLRGQTWGLIGAELGEEASVARFEEKLWRDRELGLSGYLAAAEGGARPIEQINAATLRAEYWLPKIVRAEKPPASEEEAMARWRSARNQFKEAVAKSRRWQQWLELIRGDIAKVQVLSVAEGAALIVRNSALARERAAAEAQRSASAAVAEANLRAEAASHRLTRHDAKKPGFFSAVFPSGSATAWHARRDALTAAQNDAQAELAAAELALRETEQALRRASDARQHEDIRWTAQNAVRVEAEQRVAEAREKFGVLLGDGSFYEQPLADICRSTLWFAEPAQRDRDDVFVAALALHRAFIDAAAKPLRHNLGALMELLAGRSPQTAALEALRPDLWASLFLVVPVISTPLASAGRLFGSPSAESVGWLFVEEAGESPPQAAVGALLRSRRAIVLGDSAGREAAATALEALTRAVCRSFGVAPATFAAPPASILGLANAASPFASELRSETGVRTVGVPLRP